MLSRLQIHHGPTTFHLMARTFRIPRLAVIRNAVTLFALLLHVGAGAVAACAGVDCAMSTPPVGTIAAACCCDGECDGLTVDETVVISSKASSGTFEVISTYSQTLAVTPVPLAVTASLHAIHPPRHNLFLLHQSYRL